MAQKRCLLNLQLALLLAVALRHLFCRLVKLGVTNVKCEAAEFGGDIQQALFAVGPLKSITD